MASGFKTQIGSGEYKLQFETDNKEHFMLMQGTARKCVDDTKGKIIVSKNQQSPCNGCKRATETTDCGKKGCGLWREWFLNRWELIHNYGEKHKA